MIYLELFISFLQVGLFSIGGGYAALPLIQAQVVELHGWMDMTEFTNLITISQMTPGPIAINSATFVGTKIAGFPGAIVATLGCILPSFVIVLLLYLLYRKYRRLKSVEGILSGLRPAVVGLIAAAGAKILVLTLWNEGAVSLNIDFLPVLVIVTGFFMLRKWKLNPIAVMLAAGVIGGVAYSVIK
ncbi:MAG: chromate transporter [Oscillospiraceae bacterium]|nr:chromate transporter [Oscillospiraceae bacterium]